jgi:uncharacterized protein
MPLIEKSSYLPPPFFGNGHLQTLYPNLCRRVRGIVYRRERIPTPDGDFLDLDWSRVGSRKLVIVSHGLEGSSVRPYVLGMVRAFNATGWDAAAWNFRGCSGEPNRKLRFYHSGATEDLETVVEHVRCDPTYRKIALVGFSLGGNITLKYLGERGKDAAAAVFGAVAFSVPCDLRSGAIKMARRANALYMRRFIRMLHDKIRDKMRLFPGEIDDRNYGSVRSFKEFDARYTARLHGFASAEDYWTRASSKPFLPKIKVPTLLVNALDDPFLGPPCYPCEEARKNPFFFLETPPFGGHVGFVAFNGEDRYWSEKRAVEFLGGLG